MLIHASCAARDGCGVLLTGPPGSGKSDLLLRLLNRGFMLVADDQVDITNGMVSPPPALRGLLEIRGLGIIQLPYVEKARLTLTVTLGQPDRLPDPARLLHGVPLVTIDPALASAPDRLVMALDCALGQVRSAAGAFAPW